MSTPPIPTLEEFLAAPIDDVRAVAPPSLALAIGGTRRSAVLVGIDPSSEEYYAWAHRQMMNCLDKIFSFGVKNIFTIVIRAGQYAETGRYRERLISWTEQGLARPELLEEYDRRGWRVRIIETESIPELKGAADRLVAATPAHWEHTVWWLASAKLDSSWAATLSAAHRTGAKSQAELVRAQFGEDIPLVSMLIASGKPIFAPDILPPILVGQLDCYWLQKPGYSLDDDTLRRIFYSHAYPAGRDAADGADGDDDDIIGVGQRVGGFWYPVG